MNIKQEGSSANMEALEKILNKILEKGDGKVAEKDAGIYTSFIDLYSTMPQIVVDNMVKIFDEDISKRDFARNILFRYGIRGYTNVIESFIFDEEAEKDSTLASNHDVCKMKMLASFVLTGFIVYREDLTMELDCLTIESDMRKNLDIDNSLEYNIVNMAIAEKRLIQEYGIPNGYVINNKLEEDYVAFIGLAIDGGEKLLDAVLDLQKSELTEGGMETDLEPIVMYIKDNVPISTKRVIAFIACYLGEINCMSVDKMEDMIWNVLSVFPLAFRTFKLGQPQDVIIKAQASHEVDQLFN